MTEISKHLFEEACSDLHCSEILHPWNRSCWTSSIKTYTESFIGSAKFYLLIHLVQNSMRGKKLFTKKQMMIAGENYIRSLILGVMVSGTCVTFSCLIRLLIGRKFTYYTYMLLPNTLNGFFILLESPSRRGLVINLFANLVVEYWLLSLKRLGYITISKGTQTVMFMLGSGLLFYLMRLEGEKKTRTPFIWLFTPEKVKRKTDDSENVCPHSGSCLKFISKGTGIYFGASLVFTLAKMILPRFRTPMKALSTIRYKHFKMALFFGSYIGIYRGVICYLCRSRGYDSATYALPAGTIAGISFLFKPNLGFAIASLTGVLKFISTILYERKFLPDKVPLSLLLYCFCQGMLFHVRFMHPDVCPKYVFNLISTVSNGRSEILYAKLLKAVNKDAV